MRTTATMNVNNLPENVSKYAYLVYRAVDGEAWFYGAWFAHQLEGAARQAAEINGFVVKVVA